MTVTTTYAPATYTGDGSTTEFALAHQVKQSSHLSITIDGFSTSAWSAVGYGENSGVTVTFDTPPTNGSSVVIRRVVPYTQDTDLENFDGNPADVTESQFDLLAMADQQISEQGDRAIIFPLGASITTKEISGSITASPKILTVTSSGPALTEIIDINSSLDAVITGLQNGDFVQYNGTNWVNVAPEVKKDLAENDILDLTAYADIADQSDLVAVYDTSASETKQITVRNFFATIDDIADIGSAPDADDKLVIVNVSNGNANAIEVQGLFDGITNLTELTDLSSDDVFLAYDTSSSSVKKVTYENLTPNNALQTVAVANVDTSSGSLVDNKSVGVTIVRNSTGNVTGTLTDAMSDSNYIVQVSGANNGSVTTTTDFAAVIDSTTEFTIELSVSGSPRDGLFMISVIGEKA